MLSEFISEEDKDWNLLKTSRENCLDKTLFDETVFQSTSFWGRWGSLAVVKATYLAE